MTPMPKDEPKDEKSDTLEAFDRLLGGLVGVDPEELNDKEKSMPSDPRKTDETTHEENPAVPPDVHPAGEPLPPEGQPPVNPDLPEE